MDSETMYLLAKSQVPVPAGRATVNATHTITSGIIIPFDQASGSTPATMAGQGYLFGGMTFSGASTYGLVAQVSGIYKATVNCFWQTTASSVSLGVNLQANIASSAYLLASVFWATTAATGNQLFGVSDDVALSAGDYVYATSVIGSGGGTVTAQNDARNNLCLSWVRSL